MGNLFFLGILCLGILLLGTLTRYHPVPWQWLLMTQKMEMKNHMNNTVYYSWSLILQSFITSLNQEIDFLWKSCLFFVLCFNDQQVTTLHIISVLLQLWCMPWCLAMWLPLFRGCTPDGPFITQEPRTWRTLYGSITCHSS